MEDTGLSVKKIDNPAGENSVLVKAVRNRYGSSNIKFSFFDDLDRLHEAYVAMKVRGMKPAEAIKKFLIVGLEDEYGSESD